MAQNSVAANLLMFALMVGGLIAAMQVKQEVFPEFELDVVSVAVPYPGASPAEVEQGIVLAVEEAIRSVDGVQRVRGNALEGVGLIIAELEVGADRDRAATDIKNEVDRITSFPIDAEEPTVTAPVTRRKVISLVIHGDKSEEALRQLAERARADLLQKPEITQIELSGTRPREISIEVPLSKLRAHDLTLPQVAAAVRSGSVELPGGRVRTAGGEILLRTDERAEFGGEFGEIVVLSAPDGTTVRVSDLGNVRDGFEEVDQNASFNGEPAVSVDVYRVGDQTPIEIADAVRAYADSAQGWLPEGVGMAPWDDQSIIYRDRISLLLRNAAMGLVLVFFILGLFLQIKLAFWVMLGIPISFLGSFLLLPLGDVSVNMISLFAFIITLGIVVDDAIVVGENIFEKRKEGYGPLDAAIAGAQQVSVPVVFAVSTTVVAFAPLFFAPGTIGKIFFVVPAVVLAVILLSLVESLWVLPAHLAHSTPPRDTRFHRLQMRFSNGLVSFIYGPYQRFIRAALARRRLTMAVGFSMLFVSLGVIRGGHIDFTFLPRIEGDLVNVSVRLPVGAPIKDTEAVRDRVVSAGWSAVETLPGGRDMARGIYAQLGVERTRGGPVQARAAEGSHIVDITMQLVPLDLRSVTASEVTRAWREAVGEIPGVEKMRFAFSIGPSSGKDITIELSHPDTEVLESAADTLAGKLAEYEGVVDADNGYEGGKTQLDFTLTGAGRAAGLTEADLARQVRAAFFGAEALRQQRGRDEVRVYVRLPEADRESEHTVERLLLRTPAGGFMPLAEAAHVERGKAYTQIQRTNSRRTLQVSADIDPEQTNAEKVVTNVISEVIPELLANNPGLSYDLEGRQRERAESLGAMGKGFLVAQLIIFAILAIPFRSYVQPLIIMSVIPFGLVGALAGHLLLGFDLSVISMMGLVALTGVVVNDSLLLVVAANEYRAEHPDPYEAVVQGAMRRFRPIVLTSLTTFGGLLPMIFETSVQARFLIPMALSLGFGVLFVTFIALVLVPCHYMEVEALRNLVDRVWGWLRTLYSDDAEPTIAPDAEPSAEVR
jgi:multidrug efflux pump subunit AcrB